MLFVLQDQSPQFFPRTRLSMPWKQNLLCLQLRQPKHDVLCEVTGNFHRAPFPQGFDVRSSTYLPIVKKMTVQLTCPCESNPVICVSVDSLILKREGSVWCSDTTAISKRPSWDRAAISVFYLPMFHDQWRFQKRMKARFLEMKWYINQLVSSLMKV